MPDPVRAHSRLRRGRKLGKRTGNESFIPDDVVRDILSWLPAKDVLLYRCVCKGWRDLTSTRDFIDLHFQHNLPMILTDIDHLVLNFKETFILDGCWEPARTRSRILKVYRPYKFGDISFSHNGLIVTRGGRSGDFVIYNPVYTDVVNINIEEPYKGVLCAVFYHPVQHGLCSLWEIYQSCNRLNCQYKILNLESSSNLRDIGNPFTPKRSKRLSTPILIGNFLYWFVELYLENFYIDNYYIVEYDIIKTEFRVLPCPTSTRVKFPRDVELVDIDGAVSILQFISTKGKAKINIWTLKDDVEQFWLSCNYEVVCFDDCTPLGLTASGVIAFRNGELVLCSDGRLYVYDLKLGTFRKFGQKYYPSTWFVSHVTSLVSLKKCKSDICIVNENKNSQSVRGNDEETRPLT